MIDDGQTMLNNGTIQVVVGVIGIVFLDKSGVLLLLHNQRLYVKE